MFQLVIGELSPDINLTIFDGRDEVCWHGPGQPGLRVSLPKGMYVVRAELGGVIKETHVRLDRDALVPDATPQQYSAAPLIGTALSHEYYRAPSIMWSRQFSRPPLGGSTQANSSLFVFIRPRDSKDHRPGKDLAEELFLINAEGSVASSFDSSEVRTDPANGWLAFSAQAPSGFYSLVYRGASPRIVALYLFPDWQTQIFLLHHGRVLIEGMRLFLVRSGRGFDPADEMAATADLALDFLQNSVDRLPEQAVQQLLSGKLENPILSLVASHMLIRQISLDPKLIEIVLNNLSGLLGDCPDVRAIQLLFALRFKKGLRKAPFESPPMFRAGLEGVIRASLDHRDLLPVGGLIERIAKQLIAESPWSSWEISSEINAEQIPNLATPAVGVNVSRYLMADRSTLSAREELSTPLELDWVQAAFLDTLAAELRHKALSARRARGGLLIDLRQFALTLALPERTVRTAVEGLDSMPMDFLASALPQEWSNLSAIASLDKSRRKQEVGRFSQFLRIR